MMAQNDNDINESGYLLTNLPAETLTVETIDFPFAMTSPQFGHSDADISGTVLNLRDFEPGPENQIVLKGHSDDLVHLIVDKVLTESGVLTSDQTDISPELLGYHYYYFDDDIKLYSDHALAILST